MKNVTFCSNFAKRYKTWDRKSREFLDPSAMSGTHAERPMNDMFLIEFEKTLGSRQNAFGKIALSVFLVVFRRVVQSTGGVCCCGRHVS